MSQLTTVARPYANAAFEYARDTKKLKQWSEQLNLLAAIAGDEQVAKLLARPALTRVQRGEIMLKICDGKLDDAVQNFVKLLAENNRLGTIQDIYQQFELLKAEHDGTIEALVISAKEVPAAQKKKIVAALEARLDKKVDIKIEIDESLIGGAIIKAGDLVIDGSVHKQLDKLTNALLR